MKKVSRVGLLVLMLCGCALLLSACGGGAPGHTPAPTATVNPAADKESAAAAQALTGQLAAVRQIEERVTAAAPQITSVRMPGQVLDLFLNAVNSGEDFEEKDGVLRLTRSTGGLYTYEKPYSDLIQGSSTDIYTVEDDNGLVMETIDNTLYDPISFVLSGEGGGEFVFAGIYEMRPDGSGGTTETVSRLNDAISGWSYDLFYRQDDATYFVDCQLSPGEDGTVTAPYHFVLCFGSVRNGDMTVREYEVTKNDLTLPLPDERSLSRLSAPGFAEPTDGRLISELTIKGNDLSYRGDRQDPVTLSLTGR